MKEDWKNLLSEEFQAPQPKHKKEFDGYMKDLTRVLH